LLKERTVKSDLLIVGVVCIGVGYLLGQLSHAPVVRDPIPRSPLVGSSLAKAPDPTWDWRPGDPIRCVAADGTMIMHSRIEGVETDGVRKLEVDGVSLEEWRLKCHRASDYLGPQPRQML
jgi:hypothetical protein